MPYEIETKDGIVIRNIPDDVPPDSPDLQARVKQARQAKMQPSAEDRAMADPTRGMSTFDKLAAGAGKAIVDTGRGVAGLFSFGDAADANRKEVIESRQRDKALMDTGAGFTGNLLGNVGMALAPGGALKGASVLARGAQATRAASPALSAAGSAMLAPKSIGGALAIGGAQGAIQPAENATERVVNAILGGGLTAAVPAAGAAMRTGKAVVEPFYEGGREQIVGRALRDAAGSKADDAMRALAGASELVPGSKPTAGEAAGNAGIAALQRAAEAVNPEVTNQYAARKVAQNAARVDALQAIAGDDAAKAAAMATRENVADAMYKPAFASDAMRQSMAREQAAAAAPFAAAGIQASSDLSTPGLRALMERPTFREAIALSRRLMADKGISAPTATAAKVGGRPSVSVAEQIPVQGLDAMGMPIMTQQARALTIPGAKAVTPAAEVMPPQSLQELHYAKLALDKMRNPNASTAAERAADAAVGEIKTALLKEMDSLSPLYGGARQQFEQLSKPINQMQVAQALADRAVRPLDGTMMPGAYARALSDQTAQKATGFRGATLANTMDPGQLSTLNAIKDDLARSEFAKNAGRGVGSNTVQNLAYGNILDRAGVPTFIRSFAPTQIAGNLAARGADAVYTKANRQIAEKLSTGLLDPQESARLMASATPSARAQIAALLAQRTFTPLAMSAPAILNANQ